MPTTPLFDKSGAETGTIDLPDALFAAPVNTALMHQAVVAQLAEVFDAADADPEVKAIVFGGEGKAFVAGADIGFFIKNIQDGRVPDIVQFTSSGQEVFKRIDDSAKELLLRWRPMPGRGFDMIIDAQRNAVRTLVLRRIPHRLFISGCWRYFFSDVPDA